MPARIGLLLPRSTEYTSMSFDLLDGFRLALKHAGITDYSVFTENTGFGDNPEVVHAAAEKLVISNDVDMIVAYATSLNAEALYSFADTTGKPILFLDAGMELFEQPTHRLCYHLTLQGLQACEALGELAGASPGAKKTVSASSFLDGGYRASWFISEALTAKGGTVVGNFVSGYLPEEFTLAPVADIVRDKMAETLIASFSSYLAGLFLKHLAESGATLKNIPVYCTPFLGEESILDTASFPGATLNIIVPWSRTLDNSANKEFLDFVKKEKNKSATIFHLLGWEAALAVQQVLNNGLASIDSWEMNSPRGKVVFDPETHCCYAPLYKGIIAENENHNCILRIDEIMPISAEAHRKNHFAKPAGPYSRWKNNFFCI